MKEIFLNSKFKINCKILFKAVSYKISWNSVHCDSNPYYAIFNGFHGINVERNQIYKEKLITISTDLFNQDTLVFFAKRWDNDPLDRKHAQS